MASDVTPGGAAAPTPTRLPRRPYGAPEALRALSVAALLAGFTAFALPKLENPILFRPGEVPTPRVSEAERIASALLGLCIGVGLWLAAAARARAVVDGTVAPGSPRVARLVTLFGGLLVAALIPLYYLVKVGRIRNSHDEGFIVVLLAAVAATLVWIGLERRLRLGRGRSGPAQRMGPYEADDALSVRGADLSGWQEALGPAAQPPPPPLRSFGAYQRSVPSPGPREVRQRLTTVNPATHRMGRSESVSVTVGLIAVMLPLAMLLVGTLRSCG